MKKDTKRLVDLKSDFEENIIVSKRGDDIIV